MKRHPPLQLEPKVTFESLLYRIHSTTLREASWDEALGQLRSWLDAGWTTLNCHHFGSGTGEVLYQSPADPDLRPSYAAFASRNPWLLSSADYALGRVMLGEELVAPQNLVKTDFYRGLLEPHGLLHCLCGVVSQRGDRTYYLAIHRDESQAPFAEAEKDLLRAVLGHFSLALENHWLLREASDFCRAMTEIVDANPHATFLTNAEGEVRYRNQMADKLLELNTGLQVQESRLQARAPANRGELNQALQWAANSSTPHRRVVTLLPAEGRHATSLTVRPAGKVFVAASGQSEELALVVAKNHLIEHGDHHCTFAQQHEFSPAEARVSALLFAGMPLAGCASALHLSEHTVRSHLKHIYRKTQTHGQLELINLHSSTCLNGD
jgi:DNA-binding CsgD family transcriptional regulator/PAS domain-containing protein